MLNEKFKPQYNDTILSSQYCKILKDNTKSVKEWMGQLGIKANECKEMISEIIKEPTAIRNIKCWHGCKTWKLKDHKSHDRQYTRNQRVSYGKACKEYQP